MTRSNPAIAVGFANKMIMKGMRQIMPRTGMASRSWMRAPMKGRREAIGPGISELSSSRAEKCKVPAAFPRLLGSGRFLTLFFPRPLG